MADSGLLFIPDISGFTKFVNQTEVDHSRYIIQELLETMINANQLQLQVSEVEGDAILFYRFGDAPSLDEIYNQVQHMFCSFHSTLQSNAARRICQCSACKHADMLTLKVITHRGNFTTYNVKDFKKLIGKDVISAHQLLKNDIPFHEYWLVTDSFFSEANTGNQLPAALKWEKGNKRTEEGQINFFYSLLTPLKDQIKNNTRDKPGIKGKRLKVLTLQREYDENIQRLFAVLGDINHRPLWMEGLKGVDQISSPVNKVGTSHQCILDKNIEVMTTSDFQSDDYSIIMEETDGKKMFTCRFELYKKDDNNTLLTLHFFLKQNPVLILVFRLFMKKKFVKKMKRSMENLAAFLKTNEATCCHC